MATIQESTDGYRGSLVLVTQDETNAILADFGKWIPAHLQSIGRSTRKLPLPLQIWLQKGDGPAEVAMYEIGNPAPVVCARKETEDLAQRMVKHLHLEWEPAKWVAIWPYGGERLTYILR